MEAGERTLEIVKYSDRILEALEVTDAGSDDAREDMALGPEESVHVDLLSVVWCGVGSSGWLVVCCVVVCCAVRLVARGAWVSKCDNLATHQIKQTGERRDARQQRPRRRRSLRRLPGKSKFKTRKKKTNSSMAFCSSIDDTDNEHSETTTGASTNHHSHFRTYLSKIEPVRLPILLLFHCYVFQDEPFFFMV